MYFMPTGLTVDTDLAPFASVADSRTAVGIVLLIASLTAAAWITRWRSLRPVSFGVLWFWIGIAPTSSIFPLAEVTNDHRPFLGFIGLNAAMVWLVWLGLERVTISRLALRKAIPVIACGVLVAHVMATWQRNKAWRDDETLWADVVKKSPNNGRGIMNYGLTQMSRGRLIEARDLFIRSQRLLPNYSFLEVNLGVVNNALRDPVAADAHFKRSFTLDDGQPVAHRLYAQFLVEQGRGPEAITHLQRALVLSPGETESRHALMAVLAARGATAELQALVNETLQFTSTDPDAQAYARQSAPLKPATDDYRGWFDLGWSLTQANRHLEAATAYRVALVRDSQQADALNNLGWTLGKLGFFGDAEPLLSRAVAIKPSNQLARNNLAWVRGEIARRR
jgi:protein O-mannosyl-transferase